MQDARSWGIVLIAVGLYLLILSTILETRAARRRCEPTKASPDSTSQPQTRRGTAFDRMWYVATSVGLVCFAVGLFYAVGAYNPPAPVDTAEISRILVDRLPEMELQDRRHAELVSAIQNLGEAVATDEVPVRRAAGAWAIVAWVMFAIGAVVLVGVGVIAPKLEIGPLAKVASILSFGTLLSLGGLTVFDKLGLSVTIPRMPPPPPPEGLALVEHGVVWPFITGGHDALESTAGAALEEVVASIESDLEKHRLVGLVIVGSADRRGFQGERGAIYGGNYGLSRARAEWVRTELIHRLKGNLGPDQLLVLSRGPSMGLLATGPTALARDRSVVVYGLWSGK